MRREDEEFNEEVQVRRNKQNIAAAMAAAMVCQLTEEQPQWGGPITGRSYKPRKRAITHANLMNNYFDPNSVYTEEDFRRRFRMRRHVFKRLLSDSMDETYGMSESTCLDTLEEFCDTIVQLYKDEYLCEPNQENLNRLIRKAENRGFPGMIGSLDCMHWDWKNCPIGWQRGFSGRSRKPTVVLEAVASYDTWI
ncbi:uncharacterized protein [Malus domestica]|uniref:uncharacterized protein n=1 Tax=Malus domestica TaxID=3750 RepID=UPI0039771077